MRLLLLAFALLFTSLAASARADLVIYPIPGGRAAMVLQGTTTINAGLSRTITYGHPKFGKIYFKQSDISIIDADPPSVSVNREISRAVAKRDAEAILEAAQSALRRGMLKEFYEAVAKALEYNPSHPVATRIRDLKRRLDQPITDTTEEEAYLKQTIRSSKMQIAQSKHFVLLHDTPDKPGPYRKIPRAQERLQLLEQVYETFLMRFFAQGVELEVPNRKLMVVLFREHQDYLDFATRLSPALQSAAGFYDPKTNVAYFFDQGTHESFAGIKEAAGRYMAVRDEAIKKKALNAAEIRQFADSLSMMVEVAQEETDVQVVSHECTHQMASNTGLLPRDVLVPSWVHEGLATYFESPRDATWAGMGAVNEERLQMYRAFQSLPEQLSGMAFVADDSLFRGARNHTTQLAAYGQAWALTHFLMERHFDKLLHYYQRMGELPTDTVFSREVLNKVFDEVFGSDRSAFDRQWRAYMGTLKTDMEQILTAARK